MTFFFLKQVNVLGRPLRLFTCKIWSSLSLELNLYTVQLTPVANSSAHNKKDTLISRFSFQSLAITGTALPSDYSPVSMLLTVYGVLHICCRKWSTSGFPKLKLVKFNLNILNSSSSEDLWLALHVSVMLSGYCTPGQFLDCFCIFLKNYNTLITSKICFL